MEIDSKKTKTAWVKFIKGAISAANFLSNHKDNFKDYKAFDKYVKSFKRPEDLPKQLADEKSDDRIFGFRFPLACDFLKEAGCENYAKPDSQLIKVLQEIGLCEEKDSSYDVFGTIIKMAEVVGATPYEVDKRIWLVCTGKFYYDKDVAGKRKELIHCVRHIENGSCKICPFTHPA